MKETIRESLARLLNLLRLRKFDRDTQAELQFHLDMEAEAAMARGASPTEAAREARLRAGTIPEAMDAVRDQRTPSPLSGLAGDIRQAFTALSRDRWFAPIATGALAVAVVVCTLVLALFEGVILRPLPYPQPDRLVRIFEASPRNPRFPLSIANYKAYKRESNTIAAIGLYTGASVELSHEQRPERLRAMRVSPDFFDTLGTGPTFGRSFSEADSRGKIRAAILSYAQWRDRFHSDPSIIGKTILLDREPMEIVGVMPAGFQHPGGSYRSPIQGETVDIWLPTRLDLPPNGIRYWHFHNAIARLAPGVTLEEARKAMTRLGAELEKRDPEVNRDMRPHLASLAEEVVGGSRQTVWLLLGAGGLVLLLACANIAALCVARGYSRSGEMALRQALGAGIWRQLRTLLAENLWIGLAGGAVGVALSFTVLPAFLRLTPREFPRLHEVRLDPATVTTALALAVCTSLIAGLIPAFRIVRHAPMEGIATASRRVSGNRRSARLQTLLVAGQLSLASVLCVFALLLMRSSVLLGQRDHGFDSANVLTFDLTLPGKDYDGGRSRITRFWLDLEERLQQIPGVVHAGTGTALPWTGFDDNTGFGIVGRPAAPGEARQARFQSASVGMFAALRMRLREGRLPTRADNETAPPVIVINESLAKRHFPNGDAVGQVLDHWEKKRQIIGVVADIRDRPMDSAAEPAIWWPQAQLNFRSAVVTISTTGDPRSIISQVRRELAAIDPELPMANVRTLTDIDDDAHAERRFAEWLIGAFAALAASMSALGIYCLMSFVVRQRRRELAIRVALGAAPANIAANLIRGAAIIGATGIAVGLVCTPIAGRLLAGLLYGVKPGDILTLAIVPPIMASILILACLGPVISAAAGRILPSLREE